MLADPNDDEVDFVEVYQRPMYSIENLSGKPFGLLRLGYLGNGLKDFDVEHLEGVDFNGTEDLPPHKHSEAEFFEDDDFFELADVSYCVFFCTSCNAVKTCTTLTTEIRVYFCRQEMTFESYSRTILLCCDSLGGIGMVTVSAHPIGTH